MQLQREYDLGLHAKQLLESEAFNTAIGSVKQEYIKLLVDCPATNVDGMKILKMGLSALADITAHLRKVVSNGELAGAELRRQQDPTPSA